MRKQRKRAAKPALIIAYDLETTRIAPGTPRPLYITQFGNAVCFESELTDINHLTRILLREFLIDVHEGAKFVAWNANRFDVYFIAAALILDGRFTLQPYMTRSKALRGLRVVRRVDDDGIELDPDHAPTWEFLDGMAMLGLAGVSLEKFLLNFAPDYLKLKGAVDFTREDFDPRNPAHRAYAMRDSEGLFHGMMRAQSIMLRTFNEPLAVTMGGVCIKIFTAHVPRDVEVKPLIPDVEEIMRRHVLRGGFCFHVRKYSGPIWKYDINQAYASAMREAALPCGEMMRDRFAPDDDALPFIIRIKAKNPDNLVPFYYRSERGGSIRSLFATNEIHDTWITSIEYWQLVSEGWKIRVLDCWMWAQSFNMREFVDKLEVLRRKAEGGPSGPEGTMIKATGNHSYGKTLEQVEPLEYVLARECPPDALPYYGDGSDPLDFVFYRIDPDRKKKSHHQPQIGAFITAHVRMVLRRVALLRPESWIYADTDCVVFDSDMTALIDIDPTRYGAWKIEESGTPYLMIAKKVYTEIPREGSDPAKLHKSAKGLHVRKLAHADFESWFEGLPPEQDQTQLNNFLSVLVGAEMYRSQAREGTAVEGKRTPEAAERRKARKASKIDA